MNKKKIKPLFKSAISLFCLSCLILASVSVWVTGCAPKKPSYEFQRGMCYVTWNKERLATRESDASLKAMAATGTKWVSIIVSWYQEKCFTTSIFPTDTTPSDASIIHAIKTAHSLGMKVMLKPHLDLINTSDGSWRGEIACNTEPEWKLWFDSYRDFIVHYAKIAKDNNVEMLCIGTELTLIATIKGNMWKDVVIAPVRAVYKGPLTYAANWKDEYMHVTFWDAMDYVGIDAYFPLSDKDRPTYDEIKEGWKDWVKGIEEFQAKIDKPIVFNEIGYCSATTTTKTPWEEVPNGKIDMDLQADCYKAALETFWDKDWFYGMYWWRWGTYVSFGGPINKGYSPQNKPAQDVVVDWYKKAIPKKKY